jgi:cobyrinic acid a,c-diamide synthase
MQNQFPRILIGAFRGGAGKTLVSLGLLASWRSRGKELSVFKKGPDYIDAAWLSSAASAPCYNLDTYLMGEEGVLRSFEARTGGCEVCLVEGNRGLFDGVDVEGQHSSAVLAKLLGLSVFLVVDCTKSTRTVAALLKGCQVLDEEVTIQGVILNQVSTPRHEAIVRSSVEKYCDIPVLGAIPRAKGLQFHERHLGLFPAQEHSAAQETIDAIQDLIETHVDVDSLWEVAEKHCMALPGRDVAKEGREQVPAASPHQFPGIRVGVVRDQAFHFYYPENIEALEDRGAEVVEVEASKDPVLPELDALYIGGGFPETQARGLAENQSFKESVHQAVEGGLPVYAECGGAIYLGKGLEWEGSVYPLVNIFPIVFEFHRKPQGHGYTLLEVEEENPLFPKGTRLKGHEFHYAGMRHWEEETVRFACRVERGYGFDGHREGLFYKNAYATFSHLHALGESHWADHFLKRAANGTAGS